MKKITLLLLMLSSSLSLSAQKPITSTKSLVKTMLKKYKGIWFNEFTFIQETIRYNSDGSTRDTSIWYEAIQYPKNFRIDFGDLANKNTNICRNDSVYAFREGKLTRAALNPQQFLLMKGGLYHYSAGKVIKGLQNYGYDTEKFRSDTWNGKPVYVLGADKGDERSQQFWIDAEHFFLVRRISTNQNGIVMDVHYGDHIASGGGWVEQTVKFYRDGEYIQLENYLNIDTSPDLPPSLFDPKAFGKEHWHKGVESKK